MYLHYQNITLRNATAADAPQLTAWWNDGSVMAHAGFPNGLAPRLRKSQIKLREILMTAASC